jgi:hypothetical protein
MSTPGRLVAVNFTTCELGLVAPCSERNLRIRGRSNMSKALNLSGRATPRLIFPFLILAVCLLSAFAAAAPATAPASRDLSAQARQDPRTTIVSPGQGAAREEAARPASSTDPAHVSPAPHGQAVGTNFAMLQFLVGAAVTLGLIAAATAFLLARTQAKLDAAMAQKRRSRRISTPSTIGRLSAITRSISTAWSSR